jgi:hypothetical protein
MTALVIQEPLLTSVCCSEVIFVLCQETLKQSPMIIEKINHIIFLLIRQQIELQSFPFRLEPSYLDFTWRDCGFSVHFYGSFHNPDHVRICEDKIVQFTRVRRHVKKTNLDHYVIIIITMKIKKEERIPKLWVMY